MTEYVQFPDDSTRYTRQMIEEMLPDQFWTDPPEEGTLPELVKAAWPDLFWEAVRLHQERLAAAAESERQVAALRQRMLLSPEELSDHEQRVQQLWKRWSFPTYFTQEST